MSKIDGQMLKKMILAGANVLKDNRDEVDALNVFPVPDGDTGTNMFLTVEAAAKEVENMTTTSIYDVAKAASNGALRGARGNSGVIMSQLFRGFAKGLESLEETTTDDLAEAMQEAKEMAYKAVMKPKEGTILSVARAMADKASEVALFVDDTDAFLRETIDAGMVMLSKTTEMLPQLKEAGVVDAGGQGLLYVLQGAYEALTNTTLSLEFTPAASIDFSGLAVMDKDDIEYGFCTELFMHVDKFKEKDEFEWKNFLNDMGDSIVFLHDEDEGVIKIHVHTNHPGTIIEKAIKEGLVSNMKIDNMRLQHEERISFLTENIETAASEKVPQLELLPQVQPEKDVGFVAISAGEGLNELFRSLGVDEIIEGGQTMNPSTEEILEAIRKVKAKDIFVLPNNSNIIMAANQAAELCEDCHVSVVPTKSVCQGFSAMCEYIPSKTSKENLDAMMEAITHVKTGQITYAVRASKVNGTPIEEGDYLGIIDGDLCEVTKDIETNAFALLDKMIDEDSELVSIFYGKDTLDEEAEEFSAQVIEKYPELEVETHRGDQPVYYYLLAVE